MKSENRIKSAGKLLCAATALFFSLDYAAYAQPATCVAYASNVPTVRWEGLAEELGQVVIECVGGTPTLSGQPIPTVNVQVFLNTNMTSRQLSGDLSEAVLLLDEPQPGNQQVCETPQSGCPQIAGTAGPNVFQGTRISSNSIIFFSIPFDSPGAAVPKRILRIANVRASVNMLPLGTLIPTSVSMFVAISGGNAPNLQNNQLQVAYLQRGLLSSVDKSAGVELTTCTSVEKLQVASLTIREGFPTAFRHRPSAGSQNDLTVIYNTENMFYSSSFPSTNGMDRAGQADFGTRLQAYFSGIPSGVTLYVPATYSTGTGDSLTLTSSLSGPFSPVIPTNDGLVALSPNQGSATAVWEVVTSSPTTLAVVNIPIFVTYNFSSVFPGEITVKMDHAPLSIVTAPDLNAPLPRFVSTGASQLLADILPACSGAPYTVSTSPVGQRIAVDGKSYEAPQSFNWTPGSIHSISVPTPQTNRSSSRDA